jgi:hypothetical protein
MLDKTYVETETPQDILTYISQRKRWGSNSFSNSLVNIWSRNLPWYIKVSSAIDAFRILSTWFRIFSYIWFWTHITDVKLPALIFVASTVGIVYIYTFLLIAIYGKNRLSLYYGFVLNKITTPFFSSMIFYEILYRFDDFSWGLTQKMSNKITISNEELGINNPKEINQEFPTEKIMKKKVVKITNVNDGDVIVNFENDTNTIIKKQQPKLISKKSKFSDNDIPKTKKVKKGEKVDLNELNEQTTTQTNEEMVSIKPKFSRGWLEKNFTGNHKNQISSNSEIPVPPPPPPPMFMENRVSKKRLKKFHWKPLAPNVVDNSFWRISDEESSIQEPDHTEMENLFKLTTEKKTKKIKKNKRGNVLIDFRRANNAGIVLAQISRHFDNLNDCLELIINSLVNNEQMTIDQLKSFQTLFPLSKREIMTLKEYTGNDCDLDFVDRFFLKSIEIPRLSQRMQCSYIKKTGIAKLKQIKRNCIVMQNVCVELKESKAFRKFLRMVLGHGKVLNEGTPFGEVVQGFKLESLLELKHVRTTTTSKNETTNLLDFLLTKFNSKDCLKEELETLCLLPKVSFESTCLLQKELSRDYTLILKEVDIAKKQINNHQQSCSSFEKNCHQTFLNNFSEFLVYLKKRVDKTDKILKDTENLIQNTMNYYGETNTTADQFFRILVNFMEDFS